MYSCLPDSIVINHVLSDTLQVFGKLQLPAFVRHTHRYTNTSTHGVTHTVSVSFMKVFDNKNDVNCTIKRTSRVYMYIRHYSGNAFLVY